MNWLSIKTHRDVSLQQFGLMSGMDHVVLSQDSVVSAVIRQAVGWVI